MIEELTFVVETALLKDHERWIAPPGWRQLPSGRGVVEGRKMPATKVIGQIARREAESVLFESHLPPRMHSDRKERKHPQAGLAPARVRLGHPPRGVINPKRHVSTRVAIDVSRVACVAAHCGRTSRLPPWESQCVNSGQAHASNCG